MDTETKAVLEKLLEMVEEMHRAFMELKPMIDRYKMVSEAGSLRQARKVFKS